MKTERVTMKHNNNRKRGRKAHITLAVVGRVSERFALGLTLKMALVLEQNPHVNLDSWAWALKRHPEFVPPFEAARAKFYESAMRRLANHDDPKWLTWVLERRHSADFAKPPESFNVKQTIVGLPDDILAKAREYSRQTQQLGLQ